MARTGEIVAVAGLSTLLVGMGAVMGAEWNALMADNATPLEAPVSIEVPGATELDTAATIGALILPEHAVCPEGGMPLERRSDAISQAPGAYAADSLLAIRPDTAYSIPTASGSVSVFCGPLIAAHSAIDGKRPTDPTQYAVVGQIKGTITEGVEPGPDPGIIVIQVPSPTSTTV